MTGMFIALFAVGLCCVGYAKAHSDFSTASLVFTCATLFITATIWIKTP